MIYCHILDRDEKVLYSTLPLEFINYFTQCKVKNETFICGVEHVKKRHGRLISANKETIYLLTSDDHIVKRPRFFREQQIVYCNLIPDLTNIRKEITQEINNNTKKFIHNVTSLNTYNLQNMYYLAPEEVLRKNIGDQISAVEKIILNNPRDVALTFLKIVTNNNLMKLQFSIFKKLYETRPVIQTSRHQLSKVIGNILSVFSHLFKDKQIKIEVEEINKEVLLDYDSFHTALFFIFDNASKYTLNGTNFIIKFKESLNKDFVIQFDMVSCKINDDEIEKIYEEGYSGYYASKMGKQGDGIGMSATVKALNLNNSKLNLIRDFDQSKRKIKKEIPYENNIFEIHLVGQ